MAKNCSSYIQAIFFMVHTIIWNTTQTKPEFRTCFVSSLVEISCKYHIHTASPYINRQFQLPENEIIENWKYIYLYGMIIVQPIHATFDQIDNFYVKSNFTRLFYFFPEGSSIILLVMYKHELCKDLL